MPTRQRVASVVFSNRGKKEFDAMTTIDVALRQVSKSFGRRANRQQNQHVHAVNDVSLDIYHGEFFALLGPSGCGKTTTLRMIAGFEDATDGEILIQGKAMQGVPPFHRPVNTVFQDYALFPHMTVLQNVAFGLKLEKLSHTEIRRRAYDMLAMVQLSDEAHRKPHQLSGGQQQRVALARALVKRPTVLLLDEPLGALDLKLRRSMQYELKTMQEHLGITFIYVTHDQEEALVMADRIAVMNEGRVLQVGTPNEIYDVPRHRFVADFIGETNFLTGNVVSSEDGHVAFKLPTGDIVLAAADESDVSGEITVAIRPEKLTILPTEGQVNSNYFTEATDVANLIANASQREDTAILQGVLKSSLFVGNSMRHTVEIGQNGARLRLVVRMPSENIMQREFASGQPVYLYWKQSNARVLNDSYQ